MSNNRLISAKVHLRLLLKEDVTKEDETKSSLSFEEGKTTLEEFICSCMEHWGLTRYHQDDNINNYSKRWKLLFRGKITLQSLDGIEQGDSLVLEEIPITEDAFVKRAEEEVEKTCFRYNTDEEEENFIEREGGDCLRQETEKEEGERSKAECGSDNNSSNNNSNDEIAEYIDEIDGDIGNKEDISPKSVTAVGVNREESGKQGEGKEINKGHAVNTARSRKRRKITSPTTTTTYEETPK